MSQEKALILAEIRERLDTVDLKQEIRTNDLENAVSLDRESKVLKLNSLHPNHPEEMWYNIRQYPEEGSIRIGISASSSEIRSRLNNYAGEFGVEGYEYHSGRSKNDIVDKEWCMQDMEQEEMIKEVVDEFHQLIMNSHRMFC